MKDAAILYPVFALAGWTFLVLLRLAALRFSRKLMPSDFAFGESERVPLRAKIANRNYISLLELPALFYVVCALLYAGNATSHAAAPLAWAYVCLRVIHSLIHLSHNNVIQRFIVFAISNFILTALWIVAWLARSPMAGLDMARKSGSGARRTQRRTFAGQALFFAALQLGALACLADEPHLTQPAQRIRKVLEEARDDGTITHQNYERILSLAASDQCDGIDRALSGNRKAELALAIKKQQNLAKIDVLESFEFNGWSIVYIANHITDDPYLFYAADPLVAKPVAAWSGAATIFETDEIKQWTKTNAPGIPDTLAACFAWRVTLDPEP